MRAVSNPEAPSAINDQPNKIRKTPTDIVFINKQFTSRPLLCLAMAVLITGISSIGKVGAASHTDDTFTLNLTNVDIRSLIETVSRQTGKNFIVDPRVKATVTVVAAAPVNADRLYEMFLSILDVHGYVAVPSGSLTKIVPLATGVQSAVPVLADNADSGDELVTRVVDVEYIPVQSLIDALRPLLPQTATIGAEPNSNTVVITDSAANIERVIEIIRLLDRTR